MTTVRIDIDGQMGPMQAKAVQPTMPGALIGHMSETDWKAWVDSVNVGFASLNEMSKDGSYQYRKWFALPGLVMLLIGMIAYMPGTPLETCEEIRHPKSKGSGYTSCSPNLILAMGLSIAGLATIFGPLIVLAIKREQMFMKRAFACLDEVKKICEQESQKHANMTFIVKEDVQSVAVGRRARMVRFMYVEVSVAGAASTSPVPPIMQAVEVSVVGAASVDANPPAETEDILEKMEKLKKMLDGGLIDEKDYENKKAELLKTM